MKMFPLQAGYRDAKSAPHPLQIPWSVAEKAYCAYARRYGARQSLERLAERGGFDGAEMDMLYPAWREEVSELASLRAKLAEAEARATRAEEFWTKWQSPKITLSYRGAKSNSNRGLPEYAECEIHDISHSEISIMAECPEVNEALASAEAKLAEWEAAGRVLGEFAAAEMSFNQLRYRIDDDGRDHQTGEDRNAEHRTKGRRCYTAMVAVNANPLASRLVAEAGGEHGD